MKNDYTQLFRLSHEIWDATSREEIKKTVDDMYELNIFHPPFKKFAIQVQLKFLQKMLNGEHLGSMEKCSIVYHFESLGNLDMLCLMSMIDKDNKILVEKSPIDLMIKKHPKYKEVILAFAVSGLDIMETLIVLLATKNHVKEEKFDKDIARGRYNKKQAYRKDYPITTTISIGKITESYESKGGTGSSKRPHLRRGHIRTQHYGPRNELTQKIFIQPVFVNADEGWIADRRAYNVGA